MSEPMSSVEIEDVLSSIRRLVSEDYRPMPRPLASRVQGEAAEKLVLTPAFRVVGAETNGSLWFEVGNAPEAETPAQAPLDVAVNKPEAAFDASAYDDSTFGGAAVENMTAKDAVLILTSEVAEEPALGAHIEADSEVTDWPASNAAPNGAYVGLDLVNEIGAAVTDEDPEWEPETGDASVVSLSWKVPEWVEEAEVVEDSIEAVQRDAVARALADKAEAAALAEIAARAEAAFVDEAEEQAEDGDIGLFAEDGDAPGYFDETVLRDLVRDLIREELSGALGERITRNVRKLVRAEINRALTARDFD